MADFKELQERYADFKEERDWKKFHQPKDIAMSISIESSKISKEVIKNTY